MPQAQSTTCFVMLAAGSRYETPDTNGIAHFAEHMFFKGTERRPTARDIAGEIDGIGGEFNAFTGKEYTGYYVKCAAEHRGVALDVLVDMLRHSKFDGGDRAREGRDRRGDEHVLRHAARLHRRRLRGAPLRRPAARLGHHRPQGDGPRGDARDVPRLHRPLVQARAHGRRRRRAGSTATSWAEIERLLGDLEPGDDGRAGRRSALPRNGPRVKVHTKQSDQAHLVLGVPSYPLDHPDRYALQLLATVLGGGMSSRLFTEVRERRGLAYYVYGVNHSYTDAGSLYSQAGVDINRIDEAVTTIADELKRIVDEPVPADGAREGAQLREGPLRPAAREPAGPDPLRPAPRGARGQGGRAGRGARRARRRHRRGRAARRAGSARLERLSLNLALIGPFDDAERFEKLLAAVVARVEGSGSNRPPP